MLGPHMHDQLAGRSPHGSGLPGPPSHEPRHRWDDGIDLSQLWGMVRDNARLVFLIGGAVFVLVMAICLTSRMTFKSVARLYLGEMEGKAQIGGGNLDITAGNLSEVGSEIEVLRSRSMVRRAILTSGLNVHIAPVGWKPPRFWRWLISKRNPNLLDVAADQIAATETRLADNVVLRRNYTVKFIGRNDYVLSGDGIAPVRGQLGQPLVAKDLTLTLIAGREGPKVGADYDVVVEPLEEVLDRALESLEVTLPKAGTASEQVRVLTLSFSSYSRSQSAEFLNQLMRGYLDARHAWKTEDASAAERFVTEQLQTMQESLDRTQRLLAQYRSENRGVVLATEAEALVQQVNRFEEQRMQAILQTQSLRAIKRALSTPGAPLEAHMVGEVGDPVLTQLATSLTGAREKLSDFDGQYSSIAPEMKRQQGQIRDQTGAIRNYVQARLAREEQNVASLDKVIQELEAKLKTIPGAELRLAQIGRESEVYSKMYSYLLERQQQAAITKASTVSKNRILDPPQVPLRENTPVLFLHLASGVFGVLFGAVLVVLRGLFSSVFRRESDVRVVLGPVQVFARVPTADARARFRNNFAFPPPPLFDVMGPSSDGAYTEAFRSLRTNLYRALPGEHGKVVLVTSPGSSDGKTTCALSLAAMLAADNRRVLVIDADVRNPSHHTLLGLAQEPGLRDVILHNRGAWKDAVRTMCLSVGWFDVIFTGAGANAELLSDGYFASFLVNVRSHYDFIVLDSASYPAVSDALVLAPLSDFVLSVMRLGSTSRKQAEEHVSAVFTSALGHAIVVNGLEPSPTGSHVAEIPPSLASAFRRIQP